MQYNSIAPKTNNLGKVVQSLCSPFRIWGKVYHSYIIHIGFEFTLIANLVFNSYTNHESNKFLKIYMLRFCEIVKFLDKYFILHTLFTFINNTSVKKVFFKIHVPTDSLKTLSHELMTKYNL